VYSQSRQGRKERVRKSRADLQDLHRTEHCHPPLYTYLGEDQARDMCHGKASIHMLGNT
jgi:hypothetical protein